MKKSCFKNLVHCIAALIVACRYSENQAENRLKTAPRNLMTFKRRGDLKIWGLIIFIEPRPLIYFYNYYVDKDQSDCRFAVGEFPPPIPP